MTDGIINHYVNNLLKMKKEDSGFPFERKIEGQKQSYIRYYAEREGIKLEYDNITHNRDLRYIERMLCIISVWEVEVEKRFTSD